MNIKTWQERHKPGIRAATDPTIAELMQAEIDELRAALKAQPDDSDINQVHFGSIEPQPAPIDAEFPELPRPDRNAWPNGFHDLFTAQQMRDYTQQATAPILAKLATQVALVEKCMVAMNENADRGEKAEAELAKLKAQPVQPAPLTDEQKQVLRYLYGAGELDGLWYGEANPKERGAFWWRKNLRAAFPISDEAIRTGGAG